MNEQLAAPAPDTGVEREVLRVEGLRRHFPLSGGRVLKAVDGVDLSLHTGRTLALVGESGSGKSTLGRCVVRMDEPTEGTILFDGEDITHRPHRDLRDTRQRLQMVFQSPWTSLSPRMSVGDSIAEPLRIHGRLENQDGRVQVARALDQVGLSSVVAGRLPSQLSGGQRQRVGIARSLVLDPQMIVADEPTASLDLTSQAQIVNLLLQLQEDLGLALLFITHDLGLAHHLSHETAVLYLGRVIEVGPTEALMNEPLHPYTHLLVSSRSRGPEAPTPENSVPSPINPPAGCHFRSRCPIAIDRCATEYPKLAPTGDGRRVACHRSGDIGSPATRTPIPRPLTWPQRPLTADPAHIPADPLTEPVSNPITAHPSPGDSHD